MRIPPRRFLIPCAIFGVLVAILTGIAFNHSRMPLPEAKERVITCSLTAVSVVFTSRTDLASFEAMAPGRPRAQPSGSIYGRPARTFYDYWIQAKCFERRGDSSCPTAAH